MAIERSVWLWRCKNGGEVSRHGAFYCGRHDSESERVLFVDSAALDAAEEYIASLHKGKTDDDEQIHLWHKWCSLTKEARGDG